METSNSGANHAVFHAQNRQVWSGILWRLVILMHKVAVLNAQNHR